MPPIINLIVTDNRLIVMSGECNICGEEGCVEDNHSRRTPSQQAKSLGLKSLTEVSNLTGVSLNTLTNWHKNKPDLFEVVLLGCLLK